jgi:hypothetical protein
MMIKEGVGIERQKEIQVTTNASLNGDNMRQQRLIQYIDRIVIQIR